MQRQYDVRSEQQANLLPLFNFNDIHHILAGNLGLRLTHRSEEITEGGCGDAIPLSHLAGAKDSILFVTLSSILLRTPDLEPAIRQQHLQTINQLFAAYAGSDPEFFAQTTPSLMLVYASLLQIITCPLEPKLLEQRLPEKEETLLIKVYNISGAALFPSLIFDRSSQYYGDVPSLRLHLSSNFNQLLEKRLRVNLFYYQASPMYLLITGKQQDFAWGYDFNHYPMGKAGEANFSAQDVVSHLTVSDNNIEPIWSWLKQQCAAHKPMLATPAELSTKESLSYYQQGVKFCQENKAVVASVVGLSMFVGYKLLQRQQSIVDDSTSPQIGL